MKIPVKDQYFLKEELADLDKNILIVEEFINHLIREIYIDAETTEFEIAILEELLLHIKEKREYYQNRQHESYNLVAFKWATLFLMILFVLVGLIYCLFQYYYMPQEREMSALIEELKNYGVTITECSKKVYKSTEYWLEMDDTEFVAKMDILNDQFSNGQLPAEQYDKIKNMINMIDSIIDRIYEIHSTLQGKFKWILIPVGSIAFYAIDRIYTYIKQWYKPQYKERYEKFSWLETKIEQRIADVKNID